MRSMIGTRYDTIMAAVPMLMIAPRAVVDPTLMRQRSAITTHTRQIAREGTWCLGSIYERDTVSGQCHNGDEIGVSHEQRSY